MIGKRVQQSSGSVGAALSAKLALKKYKIAQVVSLACLYNHHHLHSHTDASNIVPVHTHRLRRSLVRYQELLQ
jgi:DNA-binding response OmpR family regulator